VLCSCGGSSGGGVKKGSVSIVSEFAPPTREVPGYADTLRVLVTPPPNVALPPGVASQFDLARGDQTRLLAGLTPSDVPYRFDMQALTDGVPVGYAIRTLIVGPGSSQEIDVSANLQSEIDSIFIEGDPNLVLDQNTQFTAHARNSAGQTLFSGAGFQWVSTDPQTVLVDAETGLAIPRALGNCAVRATLKGTTMFRNLQVNVSGDVSVSIEPSQVSLQVYHRQQFVATVNGIPNGTVAWSVIGDGTITQTGLYTAPNHTGNFQVRAVSTDDPSASAIANVEVRNDFHWTSVSLHPAGASFSEANAVSGGQQVGRAIFDGVNTACLWTGSAASFVDLMPAGAVFSSGFAVDGGQQGGNALPDQGDFGASVWTGTPGSWVYIHPDEAGKSAVLGIHAGRQVGYAYIQGVGHASLWTGTAESWVSLNPPNSAECRATSIHNNQQGGWATFNNVIHAGVWSNTPGSWTDLHPFGSGLSRVLGVYNGQQVGTFQVGGGQTHAALWTGTAVSLVDLNPQDSTGSEALGVHEGEQVGFAIIDNVTRAGIWDDTAASWFDLNAYLDPDTYLDSRAHAVWHQGGSTYVVGRAFNKVASRSEAVMWIRSPN
jgi:hypothetical protein